MSLSVTRYAPLCMVALLLCGCSKDSAAPGVEPDSARARTTASPPAVAPSATRASAPARSLAGSPVVVAADTAEPAAPDEEPAAKQRAETESDKRKVRDGDQMCEPVDGGLLPMKLTDFQFTSGVEDRKPIDELSEAKPKQRVWAYFAMRNRSGQERCVTVTFRAKGKKRASLTLDIGESGGWRTWANSRVRAADAPGELEVDIVDDQGVSHATKKLPIAAP